MLRRVITPEDVSRLASTKTRGGGVTTAAPEGQAKTEIPLASDTYGSRLLKLIPAEVVTLFVTLDGVIRTAGRDQVGPGAYWAVFLLLLIGTYVYILRGTATESLPASHSQAIVSTLSFAVWVFAIGGPFTYATLEWYQPVYGAILLPLYTFGVPLIYGKSSSGVSKPKA